MFRPHALQLNPKPYTYSGNRGVVCAEGEGCHRREVYTGLQQGFACDMKCINCTRVACSVCLRFQMHGTVHMHPALMCDHDIQLQGKVLSS